MTDIGAEMHAWARELYPVCRSLTGDGVRQTLRYLNTLLSDRLTIHEVPTGTPAFDWTVPREWNVREAWIRDEAGRTVVDFRDCNLHLVGYSVPVNAKMSLDELQGHLHSLPSQPDAIPYITSYYAERWGFCLSETQRRKLASGTYHVYIDSALTDGSLSYGELVLPGSTTEEVLISTYVCHPSMANNELSGPVVTTALTRWLMALPNRRLTYRIVFIPETIGSIVYLSRNLEAMKRNTVAGFVVTCVGDERTYSLLRSRYGDTLADKVALNVMRSQVGEFKEYSYLERGSDERQYNAPGVDLPVVSIMRSKYNEYPEYHTSLDDLTFVTPRGLAGSFEILRRCCEAMERNRHYRVTCLCEPQLGKRGLYPTLSTRETRALTRTMTDLIAYADGRNDLIEISDRIGAPLSDLYPIIDTLVQKGLLEPCNKPQDEIARQ
jgi:aminopeptidase-like protein